MNESKDILAINLLSAARSLLKFWYLIAAFIVIMVAVVFLYLRFTSATYNVGASILIRIDKQNGMTNTPEFLRAFDLNFQDRNFQNEIFFLQSYPLIREVVGEMDVRTSYYLQEQRIPKEFAWSLQNLYQNSPILVVPQENHQQPINMLFWVDIMDDERFGVYAQGENVTLSDFGTERITGRVPEFQLGGVYKFGELISNENAAFRVLLNSNYNPEMLEGKDLFFRFNNLNQLAGQYKGSLQIEAEGIQSTMAHLQFRTDNVSLGNDFLNMLIQTYIDRNMEESNLLANQTIEHIERQLENISDDLNMSERQLQNLRSTRSVMSVEDKSRRIYDQLQTAQVRQDEMQRRLNLLNQLEEYFLLYKDSAAIMAPSSLGLNDPVLDNLIQELTALNTEKQRIISQDQLRNPRLTTLNISIENLKNVIAENISFGLSTSRSELNELNSRIASLNREFSQLPATQRELLGVERRFNLNDATYTSLLERRIHAQIMKASNLPDAKIIEYPSYRGVASPKRTLLYIMALFFGTVIPSGLIMGRALILNRVTSKDDIKVITELPILASIPESNQPHENLVINYPQSPMAEYFYTLRSNLVYFLHGEKNKIILVTSSVPDEGKSFTAFNLAASFAFANSKTVLVEFDLRKPSEIIGEFNSGGLPGVSSYLINKARLEEIIIKTEVPTLDIIHSGNIPPNPIGLLSSEKTRTLIDELRKEYDFVILDTPPYGVLTDSFLLMNYADLNLFVTRLNFTKKNILSSNMEDLERKKIKNVYILANGVKQDQLGYGYGKYPYMKKGGKKANKMIKAKMRSVFRNVAS